MKQFCRHSVMKDTRYKKEEERRQIQLVESDTLGRVFIMPRIEEWLRGEIVMILIGCIVGQAGRC